MARVACSPYPWGMTPFEYVLDAVADTGYQGIEANRLALDAFKQPARLRAMLDERQLTMCAIPFVGMFFERAERPAELEALRRLADFQAEVMGEGIVICRTVRHPARRDVMAGVPPLLPLDADRMARLADTLNEYGYRCRDFGLRLAVQNRVGTYLETPDELHQVAEQTEPELVGLATDFGHWAYAGGDLDALVRAFRPRLVYPRLKDLDRSVFEYVCARHLGLRTFLEEGGFKPLGQGSLDFEPPLLRLDSANFDGWVCVETEPYSLTPREDAQVSRDYLRDQLHW